MSLRRIERYLVLAGEVRALESLDDAMVAMYPHVTQEGRVMLDNLWKARAGMATGVVRGGDNLPLVRWGNPLRMLIGAPILPAGHPAAGEPI